MKKERIKQIVLVVLSFVFIGIGYFNFSNQFESVEVAADTSRNELNLGDVQLVNSEVSSETEESYVFGIVSNDELQDLGNTQIEETSSQTTAEVNNETDNESNNESNEQTNTQNEDEYFAETKLQRDTMYSEMLETYQKMVENPDVGEAQRAIAAQEITNINNAKNGIMIAENLIKNKGFEEVVIWVNNGTVSVVVKSSLLNQEQIAKIQNIVSRELKVELEKINISKK